MKFKKLLLLFPTLSVVKIPLTSLVACGNPKLMKEIEDLKKELKKEKEAIKIAQDEKQTTKDKAEGEKQAAVREKNRLQGEIDHLQINLDTLRITKTIPMSSKLEAKLLQDLDIYGLNDETSNLEFKVTASLTNQDLLGELVVPVVNNLEITAAAFLEPGAALEKAKSLAAATYIEKVFGITAVNNKFKRADLEKIKLVFQPSTTLFDLEDPSTTLAPQKIKLAAAPIMSKLAWKKVNSNGSTLEIKLIAEPVAMKSRLTLPKLIDKNIEEIAVQLLASSSPTKIAIADIKVITANNKEYAINDVVPSEGTERIRTLSSRVQKLAQLVALFGRELQPEVKIEVYGQNAVKVPKGEINIDDYLRLTFTLKGTSDKQIIIRSEAFK